MYICLSSSLFELNSEAALSCSKFIFTPEATLWYPSKVTDWLLPNMLHVVVYYDCTHALCGHHLLTCPFFKQVLAAGCWQSWANSEWEDTHYHHQRHLCHYLQPTSLPSLPLLEWDILSIGAVYSIEYTLDLNWWLSVPVVRTVVTSTQMWLKWWLHLTKLATVHTWSLSPTKT